MADINDEIAGKLQRFESSVMEEVNQRCKEINTELGSFREQEIEKYKDGVLADTYDLIKKQAAEIAAGATKETSRRRGEMKRRLYTRRDEYTRLVFSDARMELLAFVNGTEYVSFLLGKVKNIAAAYGCEGFEFCVREDDLALADEIKTAAGYACGVCAAPEITLGGVIARNKTKGYVLDESLDSILEGQKQWFYRQPDFVVSL